MFLSMIFADFMGPLLFVTPAEFSLGELSQPIKASIAMEVEPKCVHLANSLETIASKFEGLYSFTPTVNIKHILFRKCRFEKCLSVGLLPYLVNSNNRNQNRNKKSLQKKQKSSDQEIQVIRSESQNPTPTIQILLSAASILDDTHKLRPKDLFDNGLILGKVGQVFEEVYFNEYDDENLALYCQLVESIGEVITSVFKILFHKTIHF